MKMNYVIKKPLVTEKSSIQNALGFYSFEVDKKATKTQIRSAIEKGFDVKVVGINTMICRNRSRRTGMNFSKVRYWKKALVKLAPGDKISIFEGA